MQNDGHTNTQTNKLENVTPRVNSILPKLNILLQPGCRSVDRPLRTEPQVESARPIARNIDRCPDNSERRVLLQEPKYANRQITWDRVDCQSSIYLNTHVIQLPGYSTLDSTRTEQTAEASLSVRDSERCNRREPSVQMSPYYGKPTAF